VVVADGVGAAHDLDLPEVGAVRAATFAYEVRRGAQLRGAAAMRSAFGSSRLTVTSTSRLAPQKPWTCGATPRTRTKSTWWLEPTLRRACGLRR
jgi:hypothetical protein